MELDKLVFNVDTTSLVAAAKELQALGVAVGKINKATEAASKSTKATPADGVKGVEKGATAATKQVEKLATQLGLMQQGFSQGEASRLLTVVKSFGVASTEFKTASDSIVAMRTAAKSATAGITGILDATNAVTKATMSMEEKQRTITQFMTEGFSRGQSSILATAKAAGLAEEAIAGIGRELLTQRRLSGGSPFDDSASGLTNLKNRLTEVREANRLYTAGIQLTREQTRELARDKERIIERLKSEAAQNGNVKVSLSEVKAALIAHNIEYIKTATQVNNLINVEKELERQLRDTANAKRAVSKADEQADGVVQALSGSTDAMSNSSLRAAESVARYARNLRLAGVSGIEASTKLEAYRKKIGQIEVMENKRRMDFLSRALAPQISDVTVSLAGGMNPLTVLLQQGLQVRDLIGQSGVAAADLQVAFRSAASDMVSSIKGTAAALGSLFIGTLVDSGKAVNNLAARVSGLDSIVASFRNRLIAQGGLMGETSEEVRKFDNAIKAVNITLGIGLAASVFALGAVVVGLKQVIQEESALSKALNTTGAALGMSQQTALNYAASLGDVGVSTSSAIKALIEISKNGVFASDALQDIVVSATLLEKTAGISIETTVKNFAKLRDEPVKAVLEIGKETGYFTKEVMQNIIQLEQQGRSTEAAKLAMQEYAKATKDSAATIRDNYGFLQGFASAIGGAFKSMWDNILGIGRKEDNLGMLEKQLATAKQLAAADTTGFYDMEVSKLESSIRSIKLLKDEAVVRQDNVKAAQDLSYFDQMKLRNETASQKFQRETNVLIQKEQELLASGRLTTEQSVLIQREKARLEKDYIEALEKGQQVKKSKAVVDTQAIGLAKLLREEELKTLDARRLALELSQQWNDELILQVQEIFKSNVELEKEIELIGLDEDQRAELNRVKEQQLILDKELALVWEQSIPGNEARVALLEDEIRLLKERQKLGGIRDDKTKQVDTDKQLKANAEKLAAQAKADADKLTADLTDAVTTALFEGGKAGSTKLRNVIMQALREPFTVFVNAVVGNILGGSGIAGAATNAVTGGTANSATGLLGNLAVASSALGTGMAASFTSMMQAGISGWATAAGSLIGTGSIAGIAAGIGMIAAPLVATAALWKPLFGRKLKDIGIQGEFSSSGFAGENYQFYKGGLFRSDKTKTSAMDPELQAMLGQQFAASKESIKIMAAVLGQSSAAIDDFSMRVKFSLQGLSEADAMKKVEEEFGKVTEEMAKRIMGSFVTTTGTTGFAFKRITTTTEWIAGEFVRAGETASEALTRLSTSLSGVNQVFDTLSLTLMNASLVSGDAASKLVDLFGGISEFTAASSAYYDAFYSDQEKLDTTLRQLTGAFALMGMALPSTNEEYRKIVEAQDLYTDAGRETFAMLMKLAPAFDGTQQAMKEAADAMRDLGNTILDEIKRIRGEVAGTFADSGVGYLQSQFAITTAQARAGDKDALEALPGLSQALEEAAKLQATSAADIIRVQAFLMDSLRTTAGTTGVVVPAFAAGGFHTGGARIVGESGPELEITGPSRIYSAGSTNSMLDNSELLEALIDQVVLLRAEVRADVSHNAKTAKLLDRVIPEGDTINVTGSFDGGVV